MLNWSEYMALAAPMGVAGPVALGLGSSFTHCAGMCGPIHLFLAARSRTGSLWHYHAGRILGYGFLGMAAGWAGQSLSNLSAGGFRAGAILLAVLYAVFGLGLLGLMPAAPEKLLGKLFPSRALGRLASADAGRQVLFPAGLVASLLPCPSTHAALLFGMGLGSPWQAAGAMLLFGTATLPVFAVLPRRAWAMGGGMKRHYGVCLGLAFLGLSAWRFYGLAVPGAGTCH